MFVCLPRQEQFSRNEANSQNLFMLLNPQFCQNNNKKKAARGFPSATSKLLQKLEWNGTD